MTAAVREQTVRPAQPLRRAPPVHGEPSLPAIFEQEARSYAASPAASLYQLAGGHADGFGGCRDRWGRHLPWNARSLPHGQDSAAASWHPGVWFGRARHVRGTVATLAHPGQQGYFHWLFDVLPRQALLEQSGAAFDAVYLAQSQPFQRASWQLLGVAAPAIDAAQVPRIRADRLLVPSAPSTSGVMPPWVCDWLRARFAPPASRGGRRLYISRQRAARGMVKNEEAVRRVLEARGFETVHAETLTFPEQLALFAAAEAVVGPHGAGLANLVFAPPGCKVVELFAPGCVNVCYWTLACQRGLGYACVLGTDVPGAGGPGRPDIQVDVAKLERVLARLLDAPAKAEAA